MIKPEPHIAKLLSYKNGLFQSFLFAVRMYSGWYSGMVVGTIAALYLHTDSGTAKGNYLHK
jgi:hypothetical protein